MMQWIDQAALFLQDHLYSIALSIAATLLVLYSRDLDKHFRKHISPYPLIVRMGLFILMCAFGYGLLAVLLTKAAHWMLGQIRPHGLLIVVPVIFTVMGIVAQRKKYV